MFPDRVGNVLDIVGVNSVERTIQRTQRFGKTLKIRWERVRIELSEAKSVIAFRNCDLKSLNFSRDAVGLRSLLASTAVFVFSGLFET